MTSKKFSGVWRDALLAFGEAFDFSPAWRKKIASCGAQSGIAGFSDVERVLEFWLDHSIIVLEIICRSPNSIRLSAAVNFSDEALDPTEVICGLVWIAATVTAQRFSPCQKPAPKAKRISSGARLKGLSAAKTPRKRSSRPVPRKG